MDQFWSRGAVVPVGVPVRVATTSISINSCVLLACFASHNLLHFLAAPRLATARPWRPSSSITTPPRPRHALQRFATMAPFFSYYDSSKTTTPRLASQRLSTMAPRLSPTTTPSRPLCLASPRSGSRPWRPAFSNDDSFKATAPSIHPPCLWIHVQSLSIGQTDFPRATGPSPFYDTHFFTTTLSFRLGDHPNSTISLLRQPPLHHYAFLSARRPSLLDHGASATTITSRLFLPSPSRHASPTRRQT